MISRLKLVSPVEQKKVTYALLITHVETDNPGYCNMIFGEEEEDYGSVY